MLEWRNLTRSRKYADWEYSLLRRVEASMFFPYRFISYLSHVHFLFTWSPVLGRSVIVSIFSFHPCFKILSTIILVRIIPIKVYRRPVDKDRKPLWRGQVGSPGPYLKRLGFRWLKDQPTKRSDCQGIALAASLRKEDGGQPLGK